MLVICPSWRRCFFSCKSSHHNGFTNFPVVPMAACTLMFQQHSSELDSWSPIALSPGYQRKNRTPAKVPSSNSNIEDGSGTCPGPLP